MASNTPSWVAVITADLVGSSRLAEFASAPSPATVIQRAHSRVIARLGRSAGLPPDPEIFRGDSCQILLPNPYSALRVGILLSCAIRTDEHLRELGVELDARMGISVAQPGRLVRPITHSTGPAFDLSGKALDLAKAQKRWIVVSTPWPDVNDEFAVSCALLDHIHRSWTATQCEAILLALGGTSMTQADMARQLGVSQSAVSQRLGSAGLDAVADLLDRFALVIDAGMAENGPGDADH